jgi:hypothetical protein
MSDTLSPKASDPVIEAHTPSEVFCEEWQWDPSDLLDTLQGKMAMGLQIE